jgi:four helix bundle protein
MQHFTQLQVWQRAHQLVLSIYRYSGTFPKEERYGLTSQLRRAAVSVPTNLAEGAKRQSQADFARFINIAEGSLAESEYLVRLAHDLGYLSEDVAAPLVREADELSRMLYALRARVEAQKI